MAGIDITVDLSSFAAPPDRAALAALGAAFDADPRLRPERMDTGDPIRVRIESATSWLSGLADRDRLPQHAVFQRRSAPLLVGDAQLTFYEEAPEIPRRLWYGGGGTWLERPGNAIAFGELVVRLADAFDAAFGFATDSRMPIQQRRDFLRAIKEGLAVAESPSAFSDRWALRDVYWLNVYGPAFVERFGSRLDGLGVRQDRLRNGGIVIWVAESPYLYDEGIASHRDYPWKQPFYEALGPGAFINPIRASDGSVPTWNDHRRFTTRARPATSPSGPAWSPGSAAPVSDEAATAETPPDWLVERVRQLRALGFFADPARDDVRLATELAADHEAEAGTPLDPEDELVELDLTRLDEGRVWWEDTEADVVPGNDVYVAWIEGLARISRGTLAPTRVTEDWAGEAGQVRVRVDLSSGPLEIRPRDLGDYTDIETVLRALNAVLPGDGPRFALYAPFDQTAFVTCVTDDERRRLEERGWAFASLTPAS